MSAYGAAGPGDLVEVQRTLEELRARQVPVPQARVYNNANISIANNTRVALTFNSERYDSGALHSTSSNTERLTAPITGLYVFGAHVQFAANATGVRQVEFRVNGATLLGVDNKAAITGVETIFSVMSQYQLTAGDYVEVTVVQTSGGALNVTTASNYSPEFWMVRLGGYVNQGV